MVLDQINCHQCGAPLPVEQGRQFVTCEFCGAENFVDKSGAVLHYVVRDTIGVESAQAALRRWMGGNQTVKDLDQKARISSATFQLFPMWLIRTRSETREERVILEPAAALFVTELRDLTIPASDLEPYDHTLDGEAIEPTVPLETVRKWLADDEGIAAAQIVETSLVHLPIFVCKYVFEERSYTAVVDAASSKVFANVYPSKWEAPYVAIGLVAFLAYFCAALIPYGAYVSEGEGALVLGIVAYAVACVVFAIPIFGIAAYISSKV